MVQTVMSEGGYEVVPRSKLLEGVERVGALEQARERADEYAAAAGAALEDLPDSDFRDALKAIPTYVLDRDR
jgi:geranylgeranyl pyrophosphate synthase